MKLKTTIIAVIIALGAWSAASAANRSSNTNKFNVLYLNSYQYGYAWSDTILNGIKDVLDKSGLNVDLQIEYMDTKIRYDQQVKMHLYALYAHKYRNVEFDAVIVSDNNGFDFYLQFQSELFPNVPAIFCGVNDFSPQSIQGNRHISGVIETFDIKTNLELAQKFHPARKKFVVIEDNSTTARAIKSEMLKAFNKMSPSPHYQFLKAEHLEQLIGEAKTLAADAVFYIIPFYMDNPRGRNSANEIVQALYQATQAPIYSNWKFLLGSGIVGGKVIDGYAHGKAAAQMAVRVLEGEHVADIPIVKPNDEPIIFDNKLLEKFHINRDDLPPDSTLINRSAYFFEIDRQLFWFLVLGAILVTVTLVFLMFNITQRQAAENKLKDQLALHKITENELRESRQMLQLVLDNIPQHVHWKDKDLKYLGVNRSFGNFFSIKDLGGVIGKSDQDIIPDHEIARLSIQTDQQVVAQDRAAYHLNWTMQRKPDEKVWLKVNRVPLHDQGGEVVGVLSTAEDITQNVLLQNNLIETTKMEAIGTLAGGIAHDFNNILTSIINSTELALEDVQADTLAAEDLRRSLKAARRGSRLVKQILIFSRADKEGFQPTRIAEVVEEAVALIKASFPRNIEIKTHIATELALCMADPTQIHQVVMNLCTNAFQALKDTGGRLSVQLVQTVVDRGLSRLLDIKPGAYLHLIVSDNGPGIVAAIQDKIFDPFFTTKAKGEGTGLGLAVVHGIVKGHNGAIRVSSIPGQQTDFEVFLPLLAAAVTATPPEDFTIFKGQENILFVEDDEDQLTLIPRVLSQLGYHVHAHQSGKEAFQCIKTNKITIDLVITDYDMPEMNGLQLAKKIQSYNPLIPVIVVTGRKAPDGMQTQASNIKRIIRKPYNKTTISRVIREILEVN